MLFRSLALAVAAWLGLLPLAGGARAPFPAEMAASTLLSKALSSSCSAGDSFEVARLKAGEAPQQ